MQFTQSTNEKEMLTKPIATGSFIQPWLCADWSKEKWDEHFDMLLSAGINLFIIQCTVQTDNNEFCLVIYDSVMAKEGPHHKEKYALHKDCLYNMFLSAQEKKIKVFVGINCADDWWDEKKQADEKWYTSNAQIGNRAMEEMYNLYKKMAPDAFYGWYWVNEMYSQADKMENYWAKMININLDFMTQLDKTMPCLISPFISSCRDITPEQNYTLWENFFKQVRFRKGDIMCPQDSYGASGYDLDFIERHIAFEKKACSLNENVIFWVNCENFDKDGKPAPVERFAKQLEMAAKYGENLITFSYCHYYNPKLVDPKFDKEYKEYVKKILM